MVSVLVKFTNNSKGMGPVTEMHCSGLRGCTVNPNTENYIKQNGCSVILF